jgi:hypothetical protein
MSSHVSVFGRLELNKRITQKLLNTINDSRTEWVESGKHETSILIEETGDIESELVLAIDILKENGYKANGRFMWTGDYIGACEIKDNTIRFNPPVHSNEGLYTLLMDYGGNIDNNLKITYISDAD